MTINQSFQNWTLITDEPGEELVFEHEDPETGQKDRFVFTEEAGLGSDLNPLQELNADSVSANTANFKEKPIYDVTEWGATGDGVTDDAPAIQDAVDAANAAGGGILWYPEPDTGYLIDTPVTHKSYVGHYSPSLSRLVAGDLGQNAMFQNTNGPDYVAFKGLYFDGTGGWSQTGYHFSQKHIYQQGGIDLTIAGNRLKNSPATSIGCDYVMRDKYLYNTVLGAGTDGQTQGSNGIGVGVGSGSESIDSATGTSKVPTWVVGNYIRGTTMHAITFEDIGEGASDWQIAAFNTAIDAHTGISFERVFDGLSFGNVVRDTSTAGIRMSKLPNSVNANAPTRAVSINDHVINGTPPSAGDFVVGPDSVDCQIWSPTYLNSISRDGTRTVVNGTGLNSGDPSSTGEWNGNGGEGLVVYDTSVARPYTEYQYVDGAWQSA